jgi:hypothetical protein
MERLATGTALASPDAMPVAGACIFDVAPAGRELHP